MNGLEALFEQLLGGVEALGPLGALAFIPIYIVGTLVFFPNLVMIMAAGALFGVPVGFALVSLSSALSAGGVFLAGRHLSRGWVLDKAYSNKKIKAVDDAVTREGWKMVALLRLTAVLPFSVMNYALGLSNIRFTHYLLATWLGMMPGLLLYVYLGAAAGAVVAGDGPPRKNIFEWALIGVGILATIVVSVYATRVVKKATS